MDATTCMPVRPAGWLRSGGLSAEWAFLGGIVLQAPDLPHTQGLSWRDCCRSLASDDPWSLSDSGRWYEQRDTAGELVRALRPPLVLVQSSALPPAHALVTRSPGRHAVLLFQAGAASMGLFDGDDVLEHKAMKRYVVRGKGRAQPTHLKTRGKSRFGSRLRLRNAAQLLDDVSARLRPWWGEPPQPTHLYLSCPVRLFADLCRTDPPPPVTPDDPRCVRIPIHVHVPSHAELLRVHRSISRGRLWSREPLDEASGEAG